MRLHPAGYVASLLLFLDATIAVSNVSLPSCQGAAPFQDPLWDTRIGATVLTHGAPFGITYAKQPHRAFVSFGAYLGVLDTSTFIPSFIHNVPLTDANNRTLAPGGALGVSLSDDGCYVLVTTAGTSVSGNDLIVVNAEKALAGNTDAIAGVFSGPVAAGHSAINVVAKDDFAFVSQEYGRANSGIGNIETFRLNYNATNGNVSGSFVGYNSLDESVVGAALSNDKKRLFVTSEVSVNGTSCMILDRHVYGVQNESTRQGTLSLLDVKALETNSSNALISKVFAGDEPVRVGVAPNGKTVWVTARASNHLLAFSATDLTLLASVQVGTGPVGFEFFRNGSRILTADANRYYYNGASAGLSVVDTEAALQGEPAVLGTVPTGLFPREMARSPDGDTMLVTLHDSNRVQAVDLRTLP